MHIRKYFCRTLLGMESCRSELYILTSGNYHLFIIQKLNLLKKRKFS